MYSNGQWKRFAPTIVIGSWDGAPSTLAAPPATGFTGTISGRARRRPMPSPGNRARINYLGRKSAQEVHVFARYTVPEYNPLGRESTLEAHGTPHTY